jgi:hypothetical protein
VLAIITKKKKPVRRKKKLTPQELEQRLQVREIRNLLKNIGFSRIPRIDGKHFTYKDRTSEMDDVFYFENVILLIEYTTGDPGTHLLKKRIFYDKVNENPLEFIRFMKGEEKLKSFKEVYDEKISSKYTDKQLQIKIVYCSKQTISESHIKLCPDIVFFNYHIVKYFEGLAKVIKKSTEPIAKLAKHTELTLIKA